MKIGRLGSRTTNEMLTGISKDGTNPMSQNDTLIWILIGLLYVPSLLLDLHRLFTRRIVKSLNNFEEGMSNR